MIFTRKGAFILQNSPKQENNCEDYSFWNHADVSPGLGIHQTNVVRTKSKSSSVFLLLSCYLSDLITS